jgi:hypothetical protein
VISLDLPVFDGGLLVADEATSLGPKYAGAKLDIGLEVVKQFGSLFAEFGQVGSGPPSR